MKDSLLPPDHHLPRFYRKLTIPQIRRLQKTDVISDRPPVKFGGKLLEM
jgi:hypothetical protein